MTDDGLDRSEVTKHHHGKHGWAHRVLLPDDDPFRPALADLWSVHLYAPDRVIYSFTVELTCADLFHGGELVPHHTLWVTQQPGNCTFGEWWPGYVHIRYEFEPATTARRIGYVYQATQALVTTAIDHGGMWFTARGFEALAVAMYVNDAMAERLGDSQPGTG